MSQSRQKPQTAVKRRPKPTPHPATEPKAEIEPELPEATPRPAEPPQAANRYAASPAENPSSHPDATDRSDPEPDPKDGLSDQQWLEALPLYAQLQGIPQSIFAEDALTYRRLWAARKAVVAAFHQTRVAFHQARIAHAACEGAHVLRRPARRWGKFQGRTWSWIKLQNPENWSLCPPAERGGCGGTGLVKTARCRLCQGNGYLVGHIAPGRKASD
jgi:hypothetical protein